MIIFSLLLLHMYIGRLEVGYAADLVVIDDSVLENPMKLQELKPYAVMVGGRMEMVDANIIQRISPPSPSTGNGIDATPITAMPEGKQTCASESSDALTAPLISNTDSTSAPMMGPFIPGKNGRLGKRSGLLCGCRMMGKPCNLYLKQLRRYLALVEPCRERGQRDMEKL